MIETASSSPLALSYSSTSSYADASTSSSTETSNKSSSIGQTFTLADLLKNNPPSINTTSRLPPRVDVMNHSVILGTSRPPNELGVGDNVVDEMYNSLRQLSSASAINKYVRMRKVSQSSIPFTNVQKDLTVTMNEIYYTNGKPAADDKAACEVQQVIGERRDLYKKKVKSIGTSLKNCVQSDVISIDIDPDSTRLPLMCKLMIIVEGAAYERGVRVLVRDAGVQVDNLSQDLLSSGHNQVKEGSGSDRKTAAEQDDWSSVNFRNIPIQIEKNDFYLNSNNKPNKLNSRYRSSECINYDAYNQMHQDNQANQRRKSANLADHLLLDNHRNLFGSLNGLDLELRGSESGHRRRCVDDLIFESRAVNSNYFKRKANNFSNLDNRADSYLDLLEYTSTPYYQYHKKNIAKKDFGGNTIITYSYMTSSKQLVMTENNDHHETAIELFIPIKVTHQATIMTPPSSSSMSSSSEEPSFYSTQLHRNEKQFYINDNLNENLLLLSKQHHNLPASYQDPFEAFRRNMKRFIQERLNRFEAEITLTNRNGATTNGQNVHLSIPVNPATANTGSSPKRSSSCSQNTIRLVEDHPSILSFREINDQLNSNNFVRASTRTANRDLSFNRQHRQQQQHIMQQQFRNDSAAQSVTNLMYMKVVDGQLIE